MGNEHVVCAPGPSGLAAPRLPAHATPSPKAPPTGPILGPAPHAPPAPPPSPLACESLRGRLARSVLGARDPSGAGTSPSPGLCTPEGRQEGSLCSLREHSYAGNDPTTTERRLECERHRLGWEEVWEGT